MKLLLQDANMHAGVKAISPRVATLPVDTDQQFVNWN